MGRGATEIVLLGDTTAVRECGGQEATAHPRPKHKIYCPPLLHLQNTSLKTKLGISRL